MKICPKCNTKNDDGNIFCQNCGAKLPGTLALVCPQCGKVCALGTKECPVCHTKLNGQPHQVVLEIAPRKTNQRLTMLLNVLIIIIFLIFAVYCAQQTQLSSHYIGAKVVCYDQNHRYRFTEYFVVNEHVDPKDDEFQAAYVGCNKTGAAKLKNIEIGHIDKLYRTHRHYLIKAGYRNTVFTGPKKISIQIQLKKKNAAMTDSFGPDAKIHPAEFTGPGKTMQKGYAKIISIGTNTD
ncbi:zinc ribbon domain-containing protein [Limosilactobacillus sp.]|jgi:hypothetical protein|uniref:zinc ribbon domain-containing protein n=1 Tax=Limosilactobacillus sp. TaxID=2773925 RepID=UPI0025C73040|nr:zinc ribbon domain-containing protein [Limosilactobacillus sp.]MCH3922234.1 zinc ribbon domain-containing protein [Limosilactobacillus sp.]MCH3929006.1 zinc ribbon domain-containing protein [Limosilactobacillus sp.]